MHSMNEHIMDFKHRLEANRPMTNKEFIEYEIDTKIDRDICAKYMELRDLIYKK